MAEPSVANQNLNNNAQGSDVNIKPSVHDRFNQKFYLPGKYLNPYGSQTSSFPHKIMQVEKGTKTEKNRVKRNEASDQNKTQPKKEDKETVQLISQNVTGRAEIKRNSEITVKKGKMLFDTRKKSSAVSSTGDKDQIFLAKRYERNNEAYTNELTETPKNQDHAQTSRTIDGKVKKEDLLKPVYQTSTLPNSFS